MAYQIIIVLAAVFALIHSFTVCRSIAARIIVVIQCAGIGLTFIGNHMVWTTGIVLFALGIAAVIPYAFIAKPLASSSRLILFAAATPVALGLVFSINHWPHVAELSYAMPLTILAFLFALIRRKAFKNEWGMLILLLADAVIRLAIQVVSTAHH